MEPVKVQRNRIREIEKLLKAVEIWRRDRGKTLRWAMGNLLRGSPCSALALQGRPINQVLHA